MVSVDEDISEGIKLTLKMLLDVMKKNGAEQVDPLNKPFDPQLHEAMSMQQNSDVDPNTVIIVLQKGYVLNGRLVRPARVIVAQG